LQQKRKRQKGRIQNEIMRRGGNERKGREKERKRGEGQYKRDLLPPTQWR